MTKTKKSAPKAQKQNINVASVPQIRYLYVPYMRQMRDKLRKEYAKNTAQFWIPIECSLLTRYEFAALMPHTRYIYVAILLHLGNIGAEEIPTDTRFLANILGVDERTIPKALSELENAKLLVERKKDLKEEIEKTDRQTEADDDGVSVDDLILSENQDETENQNGLLNNNSVLPTNGKRKSIYSIEECLKYVELCKIDGESIQSPKALANHLFKTGEADPFIMSRLYPEKQSAKDLLTFGLPRRFSDEMCLLCFGSGQEVVEGKGARRCPRCKDEKGKSTGLEPEGESEND